MDKDTIVISAFPACGKTWCFNNVKTYSIVDSDSSQFSWIYRKYTEDEIAQLKKTYYATHGNEKDVDKTWKDSEGALRDITLKLRNQEFPNNYMRHIKELLGKVDFIFTSSHKEVRAMLTESKIPFITVYPDEDLKMEWIGRIYTRDPKSSSNLAIADLLINKWDEFMEELDKEYYGRFTYKLYHNEYMNQEVLDRIREYAKYVGMV